MTPFEARFPVRFHDVDRAGIIFFAKILEYCHAAFEDLLAASGFPPGPLLRRRVLRGSLRAC